MADPTAITIFTVHSNDGFIEESHNNHFKVEGESGIVVTNAWPTPSESTTTVGTEERTPAPPILPFLRITTARKHEPKSRGIFVFGRDPDKCDILLSNDEHSGISRRQFAIEINFNYGSLIIKDHSRNGIQVTSHRLGTLTLEKGAQRAIPPSEDVQIVVGKLMITIRPPVHTPESWARWVKYCAQFASEPPPIEVLNIESEATTSAKTLGYDLGRELGSGTSAIVYHAVQAATGNAVAVKQFRTFDVKRHSDRDFLDIRHPNIVDYQYFVMWPDKPPTLVMELVDGLDLAKEHERRALTILESRIVLWQLVDAVNYLHGKRITHRDIKPANVLVRFRNPVHVKLTDFDLASASSNLNGDCGTPFYVAPEIRSGRRYTNKVDMWSLGVLALELLFSLPHYSKSQAHQWPATVEGHVARLYPSPIRRFVSELLQREPTRRLAAADALSHEFFTTDLYDHRDPAPTASTRVKHTTRSSRLKGGRPASSTGEGLQDTLPCGVSWQNPVGEAAAYARDPAATQLYIGGDNAAAAARPTAASARRSSTHLTCSSRRRVRRPALSTEEGLQDTLPCGASWQNPVGDAAADAHEDPAATVRLITASAWRRPSGDPLNDSGGGCYLGQNNNAGVDDSCGDDPTGPASQVDSQPSGLFSSGDPLNSLLVGSSVAAWGGVGEESTARAVAEENDDLPPPWSPGHPLPLYAADTQYLRSPSHSQRFELQLATHSSVVVAHPHFPPSLAEEEVEENGDRLTGHFTEPAPYVTHPYSAYELGDNDQLQDDDLDEGTAEKHEEADGGVDDYAPPEPPSGAAAASPGPQLPEGYRAFHVEGSSHAVAYRPMERKVNALQLVGIRKISRNSLNRCFARHPEIRTERHRLPHIAGLSGLYVDFDDARTICNSFHIPAAVVDQLETEAAAAAAVAAAPAAAAPAAAATGDGGGHALQTEGEEAEAGPARAVRRRKRTSAADKAILEAAFFKNPKPKKEKRCKLATQVSMDERQVEVWFQNRRAEEKRRRKLLQN